MFEGNLFLAFALTFLAGLATAVGSAIAFFAKTTNTRFLSTALGFSAGVMIYVSLVEILPKAFESLEESSGGNGGWLALAAFFGGMLVTALIDKLVPKFENPHEMHKVEEMDPLVRDRQKKLMRMGMISAIAIGLHNIPEGMVTFFATLRDPAMGIGIAIAVALHNIPEGIAVSVPIYYATGSRRKAFFYSAVSGMAEPLGAVLGYLVLAPFINDSILGVIFAAVAGIMVFISFDELLPSAEKYGEHHLTVYGLVAGMAVMAVSLLLF